MDDRYYNNNQNEDALEQAARQQAAMQEDQDRMREQRPASWTQQPGMSQQWSTQQNQAFAQQEQAPAGETCQADNRTPYQTPVRDSREAPLYQTQVNGASGGQGGTGGYQQQPVQPVYQTGGQPNPQPQKKKSKTGKRVVLAVTGVAAAAALFFGGAAIGSMAGDFSFGGAESEKGEISSLPKSQSAITIAESPKGVESIPGDVIYERVNPSVVSITATSLTSNGGSLGSGIVMSEDGYIVTNNHVTEDKDKFVVMLSDGSELNASLVAGDADTDVAVLKAETNGRKLTVPEFGDSDALKPGEAAYAIGTPTAYRLTNTITTGSISAINRNITINDKVMTLIQTDAAINSGNSGGALVNKYGQVVGITNAKLSSNIFSSSASYEGLGFAIPINTAKTIVDELMTNGYVAGRPSIGISGSEISEATAQYNDVPQGVLIQSIDSRAKAYGQGLEVRDIVTGINGKTITTMNEINKEKNKFKAGDTVTLTVYRMSTGKTIDIKVELTDAHDLTGTDPAKARTDEADNSGSDQQQYGGYYSFPFGNFFGW